MKTDDLIASLARGENDMPKRGRPWLAASLLGLGLGALMMVMVVGFRPDIGAAMWPTFAKAAFSAAFASAALMLTARLSRPGRPARNIAIMLAALLVLSLVAAGIALIGVDPEERMEAWLAGGFPWCLVLIPLFAIPASIAIGFVVKRLAPTQLGLTGAAIGAASGGLGAIAYAMHCPIDSPAFVATWYALAIAICAALGALIGSRALRW